MYCKHELFVGFIHHPFIGHVDVNCPDCNKRLRNKEDIDIYSTVFDCNCEEEETKKLT